MERVSNETPRADADRLRSGERLSRERVVDAAVAVARRDGFDGLSMRRLANELGVSTMAAYRHVPGKDGLDDEVVDAVLGTVPLDDLPEAWDARLTAVVTRTAAVLAEFEGLPDRLRGRTLSRPGVVRWLEALTEPLVVAEASRRERSTVVASIIWLLRGAMAARPDWDDAVASLEEVRRADDEDLLDAPLVRDSADHMQQSDSDELLEQAVGLLLEGLSVPTSASRA